MSRDGYCRKGFFGETIHYDKNGIKTCENTRGFFGGSDYHGAGSSLERTSIEDEYDAIEAEMIDECLDEAEAVEWLEDHGYDPDDFDLW